MAPMLPDEPVTPRVVAPAYLLGRRREQPRRTPSLDREARRHAAAGKALAEREAGELPGEEAAGERIAGPRRVGHFDRARRPRDHAVRRRGVAVPARRAPLEGDAPEPAARELAQCRAGLRIDRRQIDLLAAHEHAIDPPQQRSPAVERAPALGTLAI